MNAVIEHGIPLVDDPGRVGTVTQLGVDETSFLKATAEHATIYATGLVDLVRHRLIDMVEGNSAIDLRNWAGNADAAWLATIEVVATDLAESYRAGLSPHLDHCSPRRRPVPRRAGREPLCRQGPTPRAERDPAIIVAASTIRCSGSANCSSPARND